MFEKNLLKGRVAFVAGGTSGINRAIAAEFVKSGANVAVLSRKKEKVDNTVAYLQNINAESKILGFVGDVREYDIIEQAMESTYKQLGELDIVVSGAAGLFISPAEKMSANAFKTIVDIDLLGTFNVLRSAFDYARRPGASFINISAPQSTAPYWGQSHACAAKAGLNMLTKSLAFEWATHGIRVNAILPGPIAGTEGVQKFSASAALEQTVLKTVPMGRYGETTDISNMALYLASGLAGYITGEILVVDGGQTLTGAMSIDPTLIKA